MAKDFRCRPSELTGHTLKGDDLHGGGRAVVALVIDRAVWTFGSAVETDMDEAERSMTKVNKKATPERIAATRQAVLDKYLNIGKEAREEAPKGRFRDPALSVKRRRS
jgi:hypothetical protein